MNIALQPLSHSCPIDTSDPEARLGKTCAIRASSGKIGKFRSAVCVDCITPWFGRRTEIPGWETCLLMQGADGSMKWPVAPVSATSIDMFGVVLGGEEASELFLRLLHTILLAFSQ